MWEQEETVVYIINGIAAHGSKLFRPTAALDASAEGSIFVASRETLRGHAGLVCTMESEPW